MAIVLQKGQKVDLTKDFLEKILKRKIDDITTKMWQLRQKNLYDDITHNVTTKPITPEVEDSKEMIRYAWNSSNNSEDLDNWVQANSENEKKYFKYAPKPEFEQKVRDNLAKAFEQSLGEELPEGEEDEEELESRKEGEVAIMLIQFNFKNFKSFRDEATLDLSAAKMTEFSDRIVTVGSEKILPVAAIYGANASGKSNIYNAFEYMTDYVVDSFKYGDEEEKFEDFRPTPFLFDSTSANAESSFEVYFTLPGDKSERTYNYGFCIDKEGVTEEWLNSKAKTARKYSTVFYRGTSDDELDLSGFPKSSRDNIQVALEKQVLIISLGAKLKVGKCKAIRDWFLANEFADFGDPFTNFFMSRRLPKGFVENKDVQQKVESVCRIL